MSGLMTNAKDFIASLSQTKEQQILESLAKHIEMLNANIRKVDFDIGTISRENEQLVTRVEKVGAELKSAKTQHLRNTKKDAVMQIFRKMALNEQRSKFYSNQRTELERQISSCQRKQFFFMRRASMKDQIALSMKTSIDSDNSTQRLIDEYISSEKDISFQMSELDSGFERMDSVHNFTSTETEAAEMTKNLIASHGLQDLLSEMDSDSVFRVPHGTQSSSARVREVERIPETVAAAASSGGSAVHHHPLPGTQASGKQYSSAELDSILNDIERQLK